MDDRHGIYLLSSHVSTLNILNEQDKYEAFSIIL